MRYRTASGYRLNRLGLVGVFVVLLVLPGCIEADRRPVSELEPPTWEVGQEWHYRGSNDQWRNWTVVGVEERRGFETYRVQVNISPPDSWGRSGKIKWFETETLGLVENQNGLSERSQQISGGWTDNPMPPRFPLTPQPTPFPGNFTLFPEDKKNIIY